MLLRYIPYAADKENGLWRSCTRQARTVVPNLWYAYPWGYAADRLGVSENNIGIGGKHQTKELK
jgi:hypothetical protein